jgi:hypothetical protein
MAMVSKVNGSPGELIGDPSSISRPGTAWAQTCTSANPEVILRMGWVVWSDGKKRLKPVCPSGLDGFAVRPGLAWPGL